jgi:hypothetical protein
MGLPFSASLSLELGSRSSSSAWAWEVRGKAAMGFKTDVGFQDSGIQHRLSRAGQLSGFQCVRWGRSNERHMRGRVGQFSAGPRPTPARLYLLPGCFHGNTILNAILPHASTTHMRNHMHTSLLAACMSPPNTVICSRRCYFTQDDTHLLPIPPV